MTSFWRWFMLGAAAAVSCDFGGLDECPLVGNLSARYPTDGAVDVAFDLRSGQAARLYLLTDSAYGAYLETGSVLPLADTCDPAGFTACAGLQAGRVQGLRCDAKRAV